MSTKAQPKQKRDLQQLLMSERRWRLLVEYNNDVITMVAKDGTILYENPALNVMSGYSPEELIGQNVFSLLHLDDQETVAHSFQEIISHPGRKIITQVRFTRKDGTCCWVEATNINCLDDPDLGAIVTYYRDITQRKEDEEALRKNEKQLQALVTSLDDIVFEVDDSGIYLNVWTANEDMLFQPRGNIVGRRFDEVFGEEASRPFFRLLSLCLESGIPQNLEYPVYLPGGERWFNARCTPIHYTNQTSKTVSILVRDVTQQKQAEELLKESEKMFRELFDNLPMQSSIYKLIRDEHGETIDWEISKINPLGAASLGVDANAVIGQSALSLFGEAIMEPYLEICRQILISGKPRIFETHFEMNEHDYLSSAFLIGGEYYATISIDITNRKLTDKKLRESQSRSQAMLNAIPDLMFRLNRKGLILDYKADITDLYSQTEETIIGKRICDITPPEFAHLIEQKIQETLISNALQTFEYQLPILNKGNQYYEARMTSSGPDEVIAIVRNISEHKRNESLIYAQRDFARAVGRYQTLLDGFPSFLQTVLDVSEMDCGGIYLFDDESKKLDLICHQGLGKDFVRMVESFTMDSPQVTMALGGKPIYFSSDHPIVRNGIHQAEGLQCLASVPILYQEQVVGCMNLASHSLAEMPEFARHAFETLSVEIGNFVVYLRNEKALRKSEEKFRKLTEELEQRVKEQTSEVFAVHERLELATQAAELGTWDWNVRTNQLLWDNQMYKISRVDKDSFTGNIDFSMRRIHLEDVEIVKQKTQELLNGSSVHGQLEYRILRGDGSIGYLKTHAVVQRNANHQVERIIGMVQDVTHEKHAESALRESNDRLSIANLKLETAMQVKDEFLASMSHELRTPLTGILGLSEALQFNTYGQLTDKQKNTLKIIENSGNHLLDLINDILDLSKIQSGKLEIHTSPSLLEDICQASLQLTKGMASQKRQVIRYSSPAMPIFLDVDTRRIKQVIVNLLSNAIKFTPERGELGLNIEADKLDRQVRIIVWDKGIGIKPEHLSKLFLPFTQIDSSLAREYSGTGLGLSLVKRLVELHEGTVTVESVFGEGTRFIVSLPWITESPVSPSQDVPTSQPDTITENTSAQLIMITDDNLLLLDMLADFLESQKYRTAKVNSGSEFFEKITEIRPDLILMDIQMPGIDGLEVIRYLRKHQDPSIASVPVIAVTALAMTGDREKCLAAGANDYMSKPVALMELKQSIQNLIG